MVAPPKQPGTGGQRHGRDRNQRGAYREDDFGVADGDAPFPLGASGSAGQMQPDLVAPHEPGRERRVVARVNRFPCPGQIGNAQRRLQLRQMLVVVRLRPETRVADADNWRNALRISPQGDWVPTSTSSVQFGFGTPRSLIWIRHLDKCASHGECRPRFYRVA